MGVRGLDKAAEKASDISWSTCRRSDTLSTSQRRTRKSIHERVTKAQTVESKPATVTQMAVLVLPLAFAQTEPTARLLQMLDPTVRC